MKATPKNLEKAFAKFLSGETEGLILEYTENGLEHSYGLELFDWANPTYERLSLSYMVKHLASQTFMPTLNTRFKVFTPQAVRDLFESVAANHDNVAIILYK